MELYLTVIKSPSDTIPSHSEKAFGAQGGTIGRGDHNDWPLSDPDRYLSSRHCQITQKNGQFFLTDLSKNGTFLNSASEPLGRGAVAALNDGDVFEIGDYKFSVALSSPVAPSSSPFDAFPADTPADTSVDSLSDYDHNQDSFVFASRDGLSRSLHFSNDEDADPLAALEGKTLGGSMASDNSIGHSSRSDLPGTSNEISSYFDGAAPVSESIDWPSAIADNALIPEDWSEPPTEQAKPTQSITSTSAQEARSDRETLSDDSDYWGQGQEEQVRPIGDVVVKEKSSPSKPSPAASPVVATASSSSRETAQPSSSTGREVINAMGLENYSLDDQWVSEINEAVGAAMREAIIGLMQVLRSRASIKNAFRMNVTTIQPVENNPLKFSANLDDALENMFIKKSNAYKKPVEAVTDSFQSIADHQIALLAGIRSAFHAVIESFSPEKLETQFEKQRKFSLMPILDHSRNWESYKEYHNDLSSNMESTLQHLFGEEFVKAYEDQLRQLSYSRNKL